MDAKQKKSTILQNTVLIKRENNMRMDKIT